MSDAKERLLLAEIRWCKTHPGSSRRGKYYEDGFIKGLKQALVLIRKLKKKDGNTNT